LITPLVSSIFFILVLNLFSDTRPQVVRNPSVITKKKTGDTFAGGIYVCGVGTDMGY
jgi:hypothetical protein